MASLGNLPAELLTRIVKSLCTCERCSGPHAVCDNGCVSSRCYCPDTLPEFGPVAVSLQALASLCLVSRRFSPLAVEVLYHRPQTSKWWLLARTALARPDLARRVLELWVPEGFLKQPSSIDDIDPSVLKHHQSWLDAYVDTLSEPAGREFLRLRSHKVNSEVGKGENGGDVFLEGNTSDEVSLLANLFPSLEKIVTVSGYDPIFHFNEPGSLMSLRQAWIVHYDTEGGMSLEGLQHLFRAAPNLRMLGVFSLSDETEAVEEGGGGADDDLMGITMAEVVEVDIRNAAMSGGALKLLFKVCPGIERFHYSAGGAVVGFVQFNPVQMRDVMIKYGGNLKKVVVNLVDGDGFEEEDFDVDDPAEIEAELEARGIEAEITL